MPETASTGDKFQVRVVGSIEGQETNNVLHFMAATPIDDVELRLIKAIVACFVDHWMPAASAVWSLQRVVWKRVNPTLGVENIYIPPEVGAASGPSTSLPSFCSALVSIRTDQGGRSKRGRMYLAGIPEGATVGSAFDPSNAFWINLVAFVACVATKFILGDPPAANSFQLAVYSRKLGGSTFPYGNAGFTAVKSLAPVSVIATTRSRKLGHGA
jgi:hypothetical protein